MIEFKRKYSLTNGNKVTKNNWSKVFAKSNIPNKNVLGVAEIERQKKENGAYFDCWRIEKGERGYIFIEINSGCGICGYLPTVKELIFHSLKFDYINIFLED